MKLNEVLLTESLSQIVFHKTTGDSFYSIVKNNEFRMEMLAGREVAGDHRASGSRFYFASFARSPMSQFMQKMHGTVVIEVDGRALSSNYRAKPVNFFSGFSQNTDEMEDRLYSYEPTIDNFNRYIESVHLLKASDFDLTKNAAKYLYENYGVDVYIYSDANSFRMLRNGVPYDPGNEMDSDMSADVDDGEDQKQHMKRHFKDYETLVHAIEFLEADSFDELSSDAQEELKFMQGTARNFAYNVREALKKVLPNNQITVEFTRRMKQYGIEPNNILGLAEIIEDKWL